MLDIGIAGASFAGSLAAARLREAGVRVTLYHWRDLPPQTQGNLRIFGPVRSFPTRRYRTYASLDLASGGRRTFSYPFWTLELFDRPDVERALREGVDLRRGRADLSELAQRHDLVLDCTGGRWTPGSVGWVGLTALTDGAPELPTFVWDRRFATGYGYVLPHGGGGRCVGLCFPSRRVRRPRELWERFLAEVGCRDVREAHARCAFFPVSPVRSVLDGNVLRVGNGAGCQEPAFGFGVRSTEECVEAAVACALAGEPERYPALHAARVLPRLEALYAVRRRMDSGLDLFGLVHREGPLRLMWRFVQARGLPGLREAAGAQAA